MQKNARIQVTGGPYRGRTGTAIRPDGQLYGRPVWLVKLDGKMFGSAVHTQDMRLV